MQCGRDRGCILPLVKRVHFFLGPWLLVCQFIEISNQMELIREVSNFEKKNYIIGYVPVLQEGGSPPAPPTQLVISLVLLHTERFVKSFNSPTVYVDT